MNIVARILATFALATAVLSSAQAREPVPIVNYDNEAWWRLGKAPLGLDEIKRRIVDACRARNWTVAPGLSENTLVAQLVVRNKHTVRVTITFDEKSFNVRYLDSVNMNHRDPSSPGVIHPFYNRWTKDLVDNIRRQLES